MKKENKKIEEETLSEDEVNELKRYMDKFPVESKFSTENSKKFDLEVENRSSITGMRYKVNVRDITLDGARKIIGTMENIAVNRG